MIIGRTARIAALLASAAGLSACTIYDGYGYGYDGGYYAKDGYPEECFDADGYLYPECEDASYVASHGYGYGGIFHNNRYGPYGWYDGFYYPGYSVYIYDRSGHRHRWSDNHRHHWEGRRHAWRGRDGDGRHWHGRRDGDGNGWNGRRDHDGDVADRDQRRDGRHGDGRRRDGRGGTGQAIAPETNPRGVRGMMRGNRNAGTRDGSGGNVSSGRRAAAPAPTPAPSASPPPPPPPPSAGPSSSRRQPTSSNTRQTRQLRQNSTRNDPR